MKKCLLFTILLALTTTLFAQTNTWTGNTDNNWGNVANWSLNAIPTASHDVVIPTGKTVNLNVAGVTKSIVVQGNSTLNISNDLSALNASSFASNTTINWPSGSLNGGGTFTNNGTIVITTGGSRYIFGDSTLTNNGMVTMSGNGYFYLYGSSIFNNTSTGVLDIQSDPYISSDGGSHIFNNAGLIKKTAGAGDTQFHLSLNNSGIINVQQGTLSMLDKTKTFNGGIYNVSSGSALVLIAQIEVNGLLTGVLNGPMNWTGNISVTSAANFNFTGATGVAWSSGFLIGGGSLTNESIISITTGGSRYVIGATTLINNGTMTLPGGGYFYLYDTATLNNTSSGVITIQSDIYIGNNSSGTSSITNSGLIQKTAGAGVTNILQAVTNSGTINASSGTLYFEDGYNLINTVDGTIKGTATIDLPATANFTNNGTFAPGGSAGTLTVLGDYKSSATSSLDVELNGLSQSTQYDLLAITGTNVVFDGDVNVTLGFDAAIGNSFTIATTTGTITTKSLATPLNAEFEGKRYTFNVTYPGDNSVRLTVSARVDIQAPTVVTQNVTLQLNAAGTATLTPAMVNNGTTDNCSFAANITYSLSKTTYTCADLGTNTVTLTATDEANNSSNATATVTVVDSINPTISCPANINIDNNGSYTLPNYVTGGQVTTSDNCSATLVQTPAAGTVSADGTYTISFVSTDGSGNSVNCSFDLDVNDTSLGVNDFEFSESSIQLYPNPVRNIMTIKNRNNLELDNAQIIDITGKVITTFDLKNMGLTKEISLENFSSGMYFVKIIGLTSSVTKRIIKE